MRPRPPRPLRLPFLALLLVAGRMALAADPVGTWTVDTAALRDEYRRLMQADLAGMPAAQRAQTEAVLPGRLDEMVHRSAGTADFRPDGTVVLEDYEGQRRTGRWSLGTAGIRLEAGDEPPYTGALEGDTMRLKPEGGAEAGPELVLKRR